MAHPWAHIGPIFALVLVAACGGKTAVEGQGVSDDPAVTIGTNDATPPVTKLVAGQHYVFEVEREDHAWSHQHSGYYVASDGAVYAYEVDAPDAGQPSTMGPSTSAQGLATHYGNAKLITRLEPAALERMVGMIGGASRGVLLTQSECRDVGVQRYTAWLYDAETSVYHRVVLGQSGDIAIRNATSEADSLMAWLREIGGAENEPACSYHTSDVCPRPSDCATVANCQVCSSAGQACLIDSAGQAHCSVAIGNCASSYTGGPHYSCECAGQALCAGGQAACRGSAAAGFSCEYP